ncbi:Insulin-induced gene 1 protein [Vulpes lagopus]
MPRLDDHCWSCSCAQGARHRGLPVAGAGGLAAKVGDMLSPAALAARRGPDPAPAHGPRSPGAGGSRRRRRWRRLPRQLAPPPGATEPGAVLGGGRAGPGAQPAAGAAERHPVPRGGHRHHLLVGLVGPAVLRDGGRYTSPDFLYIRSWLPCIFFSGGVTVGNIGRQLAMGVPEKPHSD